MQTDPRADALHLLDLQAAFYAGLGAYLPEGAEARNTYQRAATALRQVIRDEAERSASTPGPWEACGHDGQPCSCGYVFGDGGTVYVGKALALHDGVDPVADDRTRRANARLIAAAPTLAALLVGLPGADGPLVRDARAALALAGEETRP